MNVRKAVITAAGLRQRHLPLQTFGDRDGNTRTALQLLLEDVCASGIDQVALVVRPGDEALYEEAAGDFRTRLTFVPQENPRGFGHAVSCAGDFTGKDAFLLLVSDHIFLSRRADASCAQQLIKIAEKHEAPVSAVQATPERELRSFGAIGGTLSGTTQGLYEVSTIIEKPSPTVAEERLQVPGLRAGRYLCFFGMHVLTSAVTERLTTELSETEEAVGLTSALQYVASSQKLLAAELDADRYDLEAQHGLLIAQLAVALSGSRREEVLARLVELLARENTAN